VNVHAHSSTTFSLKFSSQYPELNMKTNDEWKAIIQEVSAALDSSQPQPAISAQSLTPSTLGKTIDHTLLKLDATPTQVTATCNEAIKYNFAVLPPLLPTPSPPPATILTT
jgi:hypothetical protein